MPTLDLVIFNDPLHQRIEAALRQCAQARHASEQFTARLRGLFPPDESDEAEALRQQIRRLQTRLATIEGVPNAPITTARF